MTSAGTSRSLLSLSLSLSLSVASLFSIDFGHRRLSFTAVLRSQTPKAGPENSRGNLIGDLEIFEIFDIPHHPADQFILGPSSLQRLESSFMAEPSANSCLRSVIKKEVDASTARAVNSTCRAVLWLTR